MLSVPEAHARGGLQLKLPSSDPHQKYQTMSSCIPLLPVQRCAHATQACQIPSPLPRSLEENNTHFENSGLPDLGSTQSPKDIAML